MRKFDELKVKATAATQLLWEVTGHTVYALEHDRWRKGVEQMRNRFSFSVQRGPDTPESELQAIAEFCQAANPDAILELLAIQAQLVAALKGLDDSFCSINEFSNKEERHQARMNLIAARAAVAATEVKP